MWFYEDDFDIDRWTWSKVWLWERGEEKGEPFIDRTKNREPWAPYLLLGEKVWVPIVYIDAKSNIYLIWHRASKKIFAENSSLGGEIIGIQVEVGAIRNDEFALIVLDKQKRLLTYLPWVQAAVFESWDTWVQPIPDGRGFYRIEYREREAVIYFHPLPK